MDRAIWKFAIVDGVTIDLGMPARIIKVDLQSGVPYVWFEHITSEEAIPANWLMKVYSTGDVIPEGYRYVGGWYDSVEDKSKYLYCKTTNPGQAPIDYFEL